MPPAPDSTETATVAAPLKARGGRPRKQGNAALAVRICKEIENGTPKTKAFVWCGISEKTGERWEKDDEQFAAALAKADAGYVKKLQKRVARGRMVTGKTGDWRAAAWELERRDKANFGKGEADDAAKGLNLTVNNTVNLTVISAKELADFQAREKLALEGLLHGRN